MIGHTEEQRTKRFFKSDSKAKQIKAEGLMIPTPPKRPSSATQPSSLKNFGAPMAIFVSGLASVLAGQGVFETQLAEVKKAQKNKDIEILFKEINKTFKKP